MADKQLLAALHETAKVTQIRADLHLDDPRQEYTLEGAAPKMKMKVLDPSGVGATMEVIFGTTTVASMQWDKINQEFGFNLFDKATGATKATFEIKQDGHAYVGSKKVIVEGDLERPTVVSAYTATPTKAELITAAKLLPHYVNDATFWATGHDFYVRDDPQTKMLLVKYRGVATNVSEATAGNFFFEKLAKAS